MLHSQEPSTGLASDPSAAAAWVRCRARAWKVLGVRHTSASTVWQLATPSAQVYSFATPPDIVNPAQPRTRHVSRRCWTRAMGQALRAHGPVWWPSAATRLPIVTMAFQYVAAMAILSGHHRRVLLADEVGMGKTIQAAILLHHLHLHSPDAASLIVVPAALVAQWVNELRLRAHVDAVVLDAAALRREASQPAAQVDAARAGTCSIVSIDLLRQPEVAALLDRTAWTLLVVDEAHLAAAGTARLDAVSRVAAVSVRLLLLTATPHAAGPAGGAALRTIGARAGERPMLVLRRRAALLQRQERRTHVIRARLSAAHLDLCRRLDRFVARARADTGGDGLLAALVLRRRASSCPAALVRSLQRRLLVLGESARTAPAPGLFAEFDTSDDDARDDELMRMGAWNDQRQEREELETLLAIARTLRPAGGKLEAVARLIGRVREPVLVFTAYVDTLRTLRDRLARADVVAVHGQLPGPLREEALRAFTSGNADVLITTDASAEGLNLHSRCRLIVHAEVPASARTFLQRTGRVDRYGQVRRVHAFVFSSGTSEDQNAGVRLEARHGDGERWIAEVSTANCRRTTVAQRRLALDSGTVDTGVGTPHEEMLRHEAEDGARTLVCRIDARKWSRFAARAGLPSSARSLSVALVRVRGGPPLSACDVPIAIVDGPGRGDGRGDTTAHRSLTTAIARIGRLAARLRQWEGEALRAHARVMRNRRASPGLFDDARVDGSARDRETPEERLHLSTEVIAVLERRR